MRGATVTIFVIAAALAGCDQPSPAQRDASPPPLASARAARLNASAPPPKPRAFSPVPNATPGTAWILTKGRLLGIDAAGNQTKIALTDARVLDVATLTDGQTYVVEATGLRRVVGKSLLKVHAFGERMAADVAERATVLPGPNGAISVLGARRIWVGSKSGWKGTGRSTVVAVARDRTTDGEPPGTPRIWGVDADDELVFQTGDTWESSPSLGGGLIGNKSVISIAPAAGGGVYALAADGLYRIPGPTDPAVLVATLTPAKGATTCVSTSGVVAIRSPDGGVTVVSPTGDVALAADLHAGEELAVDDLGRVWFVVDGALRVWSPQAAGTAATVARAPDLAGLVGIVVNAAGPDPKKMLLPK
jgi:hypothetical protein